MIYSFAVLTALASALSPTLPPAFSQTFPQTFSQTAPTQAAPDWISQLTTIDLNRAKNYARQAIEEVNGGLELYHAEDAMHGPSAESPYQDNGDGTWTFIFFGGTPGWTTPTLESEVTVNQTTGAVTVLYNGPLRNLLPTMQNQRPGGEVNAPMATGITLNRAKNYARQAIEELNGGLGLYQAENGMHGKAEEAPYQDNGDGTWTFIFFGGTPGWATPSIESEVTVNQMTGEVTVNYNGALR